MKTRNLTFLTLGNYTDELSNLTYLRVLSTTHFETIKLPTSLSKYKLQHLIQPHFLLETELVCTRKNWILKEINSFEKVFEPTTFADFEKIQKIQGIILRYLHEGQETNILSFLCQYFQHFGLKLNLSELENQLSARLGFGAKH